MARVLIISEVIIITAYGDRGGAELALDSGAWDYIQKTASISEMKMSLSRAIQYAEANRDRAALGPLHLELGGIIGRSEKLRICFGRLAQAARSDANLLLSGETGTGGAGEQFSHIMHAFWQAKDICAVLQRCIGRYGSGGGT